MKELIHTFASALGIFTFFSGMTTIPYVLAKKEVVTTVGLVSSFDSTAIKMILVAILCPIFNCFYFWIITSIAILILRFLSKYDLGDSLTLSLVFHGLIMLPLILGINLLFLMILFNNFSWYSILIGIINLMTAVALFSYWSKHHSYQYTND